MDFLSAKFACQKQRSILLEFDTRAEVSTQEYHDNNLSLVLQVDDFQRLVEDEHLSVTLEDEIWLGATFRNNQTFLYDFLDHLDFSCPTYCQVSVQPD